MSKNYSPAPWSMWTSNSYRRICDAKGTEIVTGTVQRSDGHPDMHFSNGGFTGPDARLILAAPELLEALKGMLKEFNYRTIRGIVHDESMAIMNANAAIAKALGEPA